MLIEAVLLFICAPFILSAIVTTIDGAFSEKQRWLPGIAAALTMTALFLMIYGFVR